MEMEMIIGFVTPDLLVLVAMLYCIGMFVKGLPFIPNYIIPISLLAVGVLSSVLYSGFVLGTGFSPSALVLSVVQGVLASSVAVFGDQIIKQLLEKKN